MPSTINFARVKKILEQEGRKVNSVSSTPSAPKPHLPCRFWSKCRKDTCGFSHTEEELKKNIRKCVNESCGDIEVKILKIKRDGKTFAARKICNKEGRRVCHFIHEKETLQCFLKRVFEGYQNALEAKRSEANRTTTQKQLQKLKQKQRNQKRKRLNIHRLSKEKDLGGYFLFLKKIKQKFSKRNSAKKIFQRQCLFQTRKILILPQMF